MIHYILDFFGWLLQRGHVGLCRLGHHQWSYTYAQDWEDPHLWHQCVLCKVERIRWRGNVNRGRSGHE